MDLHRRWSEVNATAGEETRNSCELLLGPGSEEMKVKKITDGWTL
jgi:hypothetical protein